MAASGPPIEASVVIGRPRDEVFRFYRDFTNLPRFLGDVMRVEPLGRSASRWTIQGPLHTKVTWTVRVTEERANELIRYETVTAAPLRTRWEVSFGPGPRDEVTEVREVIRSPLGALGRIALAGLGKNPGQEVAANLRRLKELLETGVVRDTSYAVRGKFG